MKLKNIVRKSILLAFLLVPGFLSAKDFVLNEEIQKCQKCHGEKFDKQVLHVTKKIGTLSKKEILKSFASYANVKPGGKKGLMKIILKRYTKEQKEQIADFIVKSK